MARFLTYDGTWVSFYSNLCKKPIIAETSCVSAYHFIDFNAHLQVQELPRSMLILFFIAVKSHDTPSPKQNHFEFTLGLIQNQVLQRQGTLITISLLQNHAEEVEYNDRVINMERDTFPPNFSTSTPVQQGLTEGPHHGVCTCFVPLLRMVITYNEHASGTT